MKNLFLALVVLGLVAAGAAAQHHEDVYLMGGYGSATWYYWNGVWLVDAKAQTMKNLTPKHGMYYTRSIAMDYDNKNVVLAVEGTSSSTYSTFVRSGIYRLDPSTLALTTVMANTLSLYTPRRMMVNQNGDYVLSCYQKTTQNLNNDAVLEVSRDGSTLTTIVDFRSLNLTGSIAVRSVGTNMDTGNYLVNLHSSGTYYQSVLDVSHDGSVFTVFGGGSAAPNYGWDGYYSNMQQDYDTGHIVGQYQGLLYQLKKGASTRTTLWNLSYQGDLMMRYQNKFDLQSAARKRIVATGYRQRLINNQTVHSPVIFHIDPKPPYTVTHVEPDPQATTGLQYHYTYGFDIYRSRNIQTVSPSPGEWDIRISCPNHAGKPYVAAMSLSGYRPGIPLPDGRKIYLVPDDFTYPSMMGYLRPWFNPGPGVLDSNGEALGSINMGPLMLNLPAWITVAVLDASAPSGIAFLPDTQVIRL